MGYDPVWSEFSPGIFLFLTILEDLRDDDIKTVDLGWHDMQIKQCFGALRSVESRVHIYAPTLRGIQLNLLNTATHCATRGAKSPTSAHPLPGMGEESFAEPARAPAPQTLPDRGRESAHDDRPSRPFRRLTLRRE